MNNSCSLQRTSKTGDFDSNLMYRQFELNLMADFTRIKHEKPN